MGAVAYSKGDIFLLCTDGLVEGFYNSQLAEQLRAPECAGPDANPARRLVAAAVEKDGRDNTAALIIRAI